MIFLVALALLMAAFPVGLKAEEAKPGKFSGNLKYEKYYLRCDVNRDGSDATTREMLIRVLTEEGIDAANQASFSYSESLEEAVVLSAYTIKKDGRRVDVPPANIQERTADAGGSPMFSDIRSKVIIFPDLAVGDGVGYSYRLVQKTPLFPGHFTFTEVFSKFVVYDDVKIELTAPTNSLRLKVFSRGLDGGRLPEKEGVMRWLWIYRNKEIAIPEPGSVSPIDYGPQILVSSFDDYGGIAAAYDKRARPKAAVTDKIRKLADELTQGVTPPPRSGEGTLFLGRPEYSVCRQLHGCGISGAA